ncbi:hypothetical protein ScalyP_jg4404 [Parmales sp. scaly parma]|nr:hypothetical protein ScalyP_jg4404 [Parmales sp. scaly parma]
MQTSPAKRHTSKGIDRFNFLMENQSRLINLYLGQLFSKLSGFVYSHSKLTIFTCMLAVSFSLVSAKNHFRIISDPEVLFSQDNSLVSSDQQWDVNNFQGGRRRRLSSGWNEDIENPDYFLRSNRHLEALGGSRWSVFFMILKKEDKIEYNNDLLQQNCKFLEILFAIKQELELSILKGACESELGCRFKSIMDCWVDFESFAGDENRFQTLQTCSFSNVHLFKEYSHRKNSSNGTKLEIDAIRFDVIVGYDSKQILQIVDRTVLDHKIFYEHDYKISSVSWVAVEYEIYNALKHDIPYAVSPIFILLAFASWIFYRRDKSKSHMRLAVCAILNIVMAIGVAVGGCLYFGSPFTALHCVAIFITFGIGIDDAFIIAAAVHVDEVEADADAEQKKKRPTSRERVVLGMKVAGPSILLTSLTDFAAFFSNLSSDIFGIREFAKVAGFMVLVDFLFQITFFVACLSIDLKLKEITPPRGKNCDGKHRKKKQNFISDKLINNLLPSITLHPVGQVSVLFITIAMVACATYGSFQVKVNYSVFDLVPTSSFIHEGKATVNEFFPAFMTQATICSQSQTTSADYSLFQDELLAIERETCKQSVSDNECMAWYSIFRLFVIGKYASLEDGGAKLREVFDSRGFIEVKFFWSELADFREDSVGRVALDELVKFGEDNINIVGSEVCMVYQKSLEDILPDINFMQNMRLVMGEVSPHLETHVYSRYFFTIEPLATIISNTVKSFSLMLCVVIGICFLILADLSIATMVVLSVLMIELIVFGSIHFFGYQFNMLTSVNLIVSVGLSVDFSAHIAHAYLHSGKVEVEEKIRDAYKVVGTSIWNGAFSTLLALLPMCLCKSYVLVLFWVMTSWVIVLGVWFGLVVLPIMLSFFGERSECNVYRRQLNVEMEEEGEGEVEVEEEEEEEEEEAGGKMKNVEMVESQSLVALPQSRL